MVLAQVSISAGVAFLFEVVLLVVLVVVLVAMLGVVVVVGMPSMSVGAPGTGTVDGAVVTAGAGTVEGRDGPEAGP